MNCSDSLQSNNEVLYTYMIIYIQGFFTFSDLTIKYNSMFYNKFMNHVKFLMYHEMIHATLCQCERND